MERSWDDRLLQAVPRLPEEVLRLIQHGTNDEYLTGLARAATHPTHSYTLLTACDDLFVALLIRIHQHAPFVDLVSTLGRVVPLAPHLTDCAISLLSDRAFGLDDAPTADEVTAYLLGFFRLLRHDFRAFDSLIDLAKLSSLLQSPVMVHRYLAIRIMQLCANGADHWFEQMLQHYIGQDESETGIDGAWDDKTIDYRFLTLWEAWRHDQFKTTHGCASTHNRRLEDSDLGSACVRVGQTVFYSASEQPLRSGFVITDSAKHNLENLGHALKHKQPILLSGPPSSGKTAILNQAAAQFGKQQSLVTLHLNEQSDAKLLLGVYATGTTPGSITWTPGVLTNAVQQGKWILIEDIDRAPNHVLGALLPLIEQRTLSIPSRKQVIHAHNDFRLFATYSTSPRARTILPSMLGRRHWTDVSIEPLTTTEMISIVREQYPSLARLLPQMLSVFEGVQQLCSTSSFSARTKSGLIRVISVTDFFKWCRRASRYLGPTFTSEALDNIFLEAADCFTAALPQDRASADILAIIAQHLHIDPQRRDFLTQQRPTQYEESTKAIRIGRYSLSRTSSIKTTEYNPFSANDHVLHNMERIAASVSAREPTLLVGETGVGKTTAVQHLARQLGKKLVPFNLSQQSESGDLLGSLKPMNMRTSIVALKDDFDTLFETSFSFSKNQQFIEQVNKYFARGQYKAVCKLWRTALKMVEEQKSVPSKHDEIVSKKRKPNALDPVRLAAWLDFADKLTEVERQISGGKDGLTFRFVEGNIVKALRSGDWVLLDEINLASSDTLEAITDILDPQQPSILLTEAGMTERIEAHPEFRIFAAMNPANDVGKKDLPPSIRSRFTEIYVSSPDKDLKSLQSIVQAYLRKVAGIDAQVSTDVSLVYQQIISLSAQNKLVDGAGQRPHFSLRTLTRVLSYAKFIASQCSLRRALYEGFQMSFMTFLDAESAKLVLPIIQQHLLRKPTNWPSELKKVLNKPADGSSYVLGYPSSKHWIKQGTQPLQDQDHYIITPFIQTNLENLVRASSTRQFPVLVQGPTSSGKTSMIEYLAKRTGNVFVRINNHEHTDLQEYLGSYVSASDGSIRFQEGLLVQALREGHWIVLDELNLAPTDVLEALNRLLDDNRELLIPETQETVRPHPNFMLFATQNPAGLYGGRKALSRAFRNRFLELHFDDIPIDELQEILHRRTQLPESRCRKIVAVYRELSILRQENRLFEQKSFATLRDLFRWALRTNDTIEQLANNGFMLLAERVRKPQERIAIKEVLEKVMSQRGPRVEIDEDDLYSLSSPELQHLQQTAGHANVVWTTAMRRLFTLVLEATKHNEPVLLVGGTGCGKTTVCQMLAEAKALPLHVVNAHQNTETSDLIGSQRPVRNRGAMEQELRQLLTQTVDQAELSTGDLLSAYEAAVAKLDDTQRQLVLQSTAHQEIARLVTRGKALFEWVDGSLVQAMKSGHLFLLDEISLADDSVLERMNSVLEPSRTVLLAEKGSMDSFVTAAPDFQFLATMNPGGDYGKKELSPALRNRFTEIWVPPMSNTSDLLQIIRHSLINTAKPASSGMLDFAQWFSNKFRPTDEAGLSIREILSWVAFVNLFAEDSLGSSIVHGAALVYIDTLGANPAGLTTMTSQDVHSDRQRSLVHLGSTFGVPAQQISTTDYSVTLTDDELIVGPFKLARLDSNNANSEQFNFAARATRINALRIVRAMQLSKPIMLEGNPGVGKTALITAIASSAGVPLTRINLSDQTDLIDLFGSDAPVQGAAPGSFEWREAPFLRAMRTGQWVLLDEMNLASQSVLEGLNAVLDHRGEAFVPELGQTFVKHPEFRLFAAQNPHHQGGGRKGLPSSFVNRFTVVYADPFDASDLQLLGSVAYPDVKADALRQIVLFISTVEADVSHHKAFGQTGAPWEFNLRDISKWLQLASSPKAFADGGNAHDFADFLVRQRFRTVNDQARVDQIFNAVFSVAQASDSTLSLASNKMQIGLAMWSRDELHAAVATFKHTNITLPIRLIQHVLLCVQFAWPLLLIGPSGSGKSSVITQLAAATGNDVVTISLSADTDTMDLIGGYEQSDHLREVNAAMCDFEREYETQMKSDIAGAGRSMQRLQRWRLIRDQYLNERLSLQQLREEVAAMEMMDTLAAALDDIEPSNNSAHFVWVDGVLVDALRSGKWIILDNANLCSASVLDRLNSLLEPNGALIINEHVEADGSPILIKPDPRTRIFLTADPQYGELSRAMRNRAVELFTGAYDTAGEQVMIESAMQRFQRVVHVPKVAQAVGLDRAVAITAQQFGLADQTMLQRFERQLSLGLYDLTGALLSLQPTDYRENLAALYDGAVKMRHISADYALVQTINPLNHQLLLSYTESLSTSAIRGGFCYDLLNAVKPIVAAMAKIRANKGLLSRVQRFETQYIQNDKSWAGQSTPLMLSTIEALLETARESYKNELSTVQQLHETFARHTYLMTIINLALQGFDNGSQDPARIFGYLAILQQEANTVSGASIGTALIPKATPSAWGSYCNALWQQLKPSVPTSTAAYESLITLQHLCEQYDAISQSTDQTVEDVVHLRMSLSEAFRAACSIAETDLRPVIAQFQETLNQTTTVSQEAVSAGVRHFATCFRKVWQRFELARKTGHRAIDTVMLQQVSYLGGIATLGDALAHIKLQQHNTALLDATFFFNNEDLLPLDNISVESLLVSLAATETVSIRNLPDLRIQLDVLSKSVLGWSNVMQRPRLDMLDDLLQRVYSQITDSFDIVKTTEMLEDGSVIASLREPAVTRIQSYMQTAKRAGPDRWSAASESWMSIGMLGLMAYLPEGMYDPGLSSILTYESFGLCKDDLKDQRIAIQAIGEQLTGQLSSWRLRIFDDTLSQLDQSPMRPDVIRPTPSKAVALSKDFAALRKLLESAVKNSDLGISIALSRSAASNLASIRTRLETEYRQYADFVGPAIAFIDCLLIGHGIAQQAESNAVHSQHLSAVAELVPFVSSRSIGLEDQQHLLDALPQHATVSQRLAWLNVVAIQCSVGKVRLVDQAVDDQFAALYELWRSELSSDQKRHAAKTSLFRYQADDEADDDVQLAAEIAELFSTSTELNDDVSKQPTDRRINDLAPEIAALHARLCSSNTSSVGGILSLLQQTAQLNPRSFPDDERLSALPVILAPMHRLRTEISSGSTIPTTYNFYKDACIPKVNALHDLVRKIHKRFSDLHSEWPEHALPVEMIRECDSILNMPFKSTLPLLLQPLERLHRILNEWQKIAHSGISAAELYDAVTDTIIDWRRLELATWASLFRDQDRQCQTDAKSWWFTAYETIVATMPEETDQLEKHLEMLINTLQAFVEGCGLGEYEARLQLISQFATWLETDQSQGPVGSRLAETLHNFVAYYSRYTSSLQQHFAQSRTRLEQAVKEVVQLASWKDRNIDSLQQSAQASHRKLARILRKYRRLLAEPVQSIVTSAQDARAESVHDKLTTNGNLRLPSAADAETMLATAIWPNRPARYRNSKITSQLILQKLSLHRGQYPSAQLDAFLSDVKSSVKEMRNATPAFKTTDNEKALGQLKGRKRRLLADVLKAMRSMGLQSNMSADVLARQSSLPAVLTRLESTLNAHDMSSRPGLAGLFAWLSLMPAVRNGARKHSEELTDKEAQRCVVLLESLLNCSLTQHNHTSAMDRSMARLKQIQAEIEAITSAERLTTCDSKLFMDVLIEQDRFVTVTLAGLDLVAKHLDLLQDQTSTSIIQLREKAQQAEALVRAIHKSTAVGSSVQSCSTQDALNELISLTSTIGTEVLQLDSSQPALGYILSHIQQWTPTRSLKYGSHGSINIDSWTQQLQSCLDSILARTDAIDHYTPTSSEIDDWLKEEQQRLTVLWHNLKTEETTRQLRALLDVLPDLQDGYLSDAVSALTSILPILQANIAALDHIFTRCIHLQASLSALGYELSNIWLTMAERGFCTPSEKDKSDESKSGKAEAGTGLGAGDGAEDISKDVKQDEDLSELAQQEGTKEQEGGIEDEKDAVDMADEDLQGELGDAETGSQTEDGDEQGSQNADMDEEIASVNSDDAEALDEKKWDDGKLDDGESKNDDKGTGTKDDEVAAGRDAEDDAASPLEQGEEDQTSEMGANEDVVQQTEGGQVDPHIQQEDVLDLSDDMNMDNEASEHESIGSDIEMDSASGDSLPDEQVDDQQQAAQQEETDDLPDAEGEHAAEEDAVTQEQDNNADDLLQADAAANEQELDQQDGVVAGETGTGYDPDEKDQLETAQSSNTTDEAQQGESGAQDDTLGTQGQSSGKPEDTMQDVSAQDQPTEAAAQFKKLGDVLEKWNKQHQPIARPQEQTNDQEPAVEESKQEESQFEHLQDEEDVGDTQAVGVGGVDSGTALPDDMSVDEETEEHDTEQPPQRANASDLSDSDEKDPQELTDQQQQTTSKAFLGENKQANDSSMPQEEDQESNVDDMDLQLVKTHISEEQNASMDMAEARALWTEHESSTRHLSLMLTEHLRLILQPTQATKMRGDFRTGKRLNIKKIIPYIASSYRRDKIWMRRSVPSKRTYQIMLAIDDSKSMAEGDNKALAYETLAMVSRALTMLEVGELCVVGFGSDVSVAHDFAAPFTADAGPELFRHFTFSQTHTDVRRLLARSIDLFRAARLRATGSASDLWQLQIIVSDGVCEDHPSIRQLVRQAQEERIMVVFIVVDTVIGNESASSEKKQSILDLQKAEFTKDVAGEMQLQMVKYLDTFPFRYYLLVSDVRELPGVLAGALRQWFSEVVETGSG